MDACGARSGDCDYEHVPLTVRYSAILFYSSRQNTYVYPIAGFAWGLGVTPEVDSTQYDLFQQRFALRLESFCTFDDSFWLGRKCLTAQ